MFTGMRDIWKREVKLKKYAALNKISMYGEHYVMVVNGQAALVV